jgi:hypothetical protein
VLALGAAGHDTPGGDGGRRAMIAALNMAHTETRVVAAVRQGGNWAAGPMQQGVQAAVAAAVAAAAAATAVAAAAAEAAAACGGGCGVAAGAAGVGGIGAAPPPAPPGGCYGCLGPLEDDYNQQAARAVYFLPTCQPLYPHPMIMFSEVRATRYAALARAGANHGLVAVQWVLW